MGLEHEVANISTVKSNVDSCELGNLKCALKSILEDDPFPECPDTKIMFYSRSIAILNYEESYVSNGSNQTANVSPVSSQAGSEITGRVKSISL